MYVPATIISGNTITSEASAATIIKPSIIIPAKSGKIASPIDFIDYPLKSYYHPAFSAASKVNVNSTILSINSSLVI